MTLITSAVGTPKDCMTSFACSFEPSNLAPTASGPKLGIPLERRASERPETNGASGPTTTKSAPIVSASETIESTSDAETE